ncbi:hypothetical protein BpHYR1_044061 [Brachionus plicatilis]|uniref:Uncharacterized protein n=1 Tax=Brachionus plicatilis TaxID=10195 RepID=A0A3M7PWS1_BRAPC|nr:hypothetical protein BpHYR1_044061 [Brachionus plicatilis]
MDEIKERSTRIIFLHEEEGKYVLVDAVISNDTIFKVPKKKTTKFIKENNTDYKPNLEKTLKEISTQLFQLNQKANQPVNQNNSDQIGVKTAQPETLISPRFKRRAATPELIESEDELSNIYTQKDFTNDFPYLKKFVPSKSDFSTAWFNATNSIKNDRAAAKK